jgi:integrase
MFAQLLAKVASGENSLRDQAMVLLSFKAGLRAQEIAGLEWTDVTDAKGVIRSDHFLVPSDIAKQKREATLPMHPHLHIVLTQLRTLRPHDRYVIYSLRPQQLKKGRQDRKMSPAAVTMWFKRLYEEHKLEGCSSHSGRRTFITRLARNAGHHDCSIRDVQVLARHQHLTTTERYIEPSANIGRLVSAI